MANPRSVKILGVNRIILYKQKNVKNLRWKLSPPAKYCMAIYKKKKECNESAQKIVITV